MGIALSIGWGDFLCISVTFILYIYGAKGTGMV